METGALVDRAGYDTLWTWDHVYPIVGDPDGPIFEGYMTLAGWAHRTERVRLGLMVGANTFRNPAPRREDGHGARPHEQRPHVARDRRRVVRDRAHRLRDPVRLGLRRAARLVRRVGRADEEHAPRRAGVGARALLPGEGRAQQPAARAGAPADHDRRQRRAEDAAHGREVRRRLEHERRSRARPAQGRGAPPLVRRGRPRPHRDRAHARRQRPDHPRHRGGGAQGRGGDEGAQQGLARAARRAVRPGRARRREVGAVPRPRLRAHLHRLPGAVRPRDDRAARDRGQADARVAAEPLLQLRR